MGCDPSETSYAPRGFTGGGGGGRNRGATHDYGTMRVAQCPVDVAFERMKGLSAPGAPRAVEGFTPRINLPGNLWGSGPPNPISQYVNSRTGTIINQTLDEHDYHRGSVTIRVTPINGGRWSVIRIRGTGTGPNPLENELAGFAFFDSAANAVAKLCNPNAGSPTP